MNNSATASDGTLEPVQWTISNRKRYRPGSEAPPTTYDVPTTVGSVKLGKAEHMNPDGEKKITYSVRAFDQESKNTYTVETNEDQLRQILTTTKDDSKSQQLSLSHRLLRDAALNLGFDDSKICSKKIPLTTKKGTEYTYWIHFRPGMDTINDKDTRFFFERKDRADEGRTGWDIGLTMDEFEDRAKKDSEISEILAAVRFRNYDDDEPLGPKGSVSSEAGKIDWETCPVLSKETGDFTYALNVSEQGNKGNCRIWMTLEQLEEESKTNGHSGLDKLVYEDIMSETGGKGTKPKASSGVQAVSDETNSSSSTSNYVVKSKL